MYTVKALGQQAKVGLFFFFAGVIIVVYCTVVCCTVEAKNQPGSKARSILLPKYIFVLQMSPQHERLKASIKAKITL